MGLFYPPSSRTGQFRSLGAVLQRIVLDTLNSFFPSAPCSLLRKFVVLKYLIKSHEVGVSVSVAYSRQSMNSISMTFTQER